MNKRGREFGTPDVSPKFTMQSVAAALRAHGLHTLKTIKETYCLWKKIP